MTMISPYDNCSRSLEYVGGYVTLGSRLSLAWLAIFVQSLNIFLHVRPKEMSFI